MPKQPHYEEESIRNFALDPSCPGKEMSMRKNMKSPFPAGFDPVAAYAVASPRSRILSLHLTFEEADAQLKRIGDIPDAFIKPLFD